LRLVSYVKTVLLFPCHAGLTQHSITVLGSSANILLHLSTSNICYFNNYDWKTVFFCWCV